jgi:hypothetical protein
LRERTPNSAAKVSIYFNSRHLRQRFFAFCIFLNCPPFAAAAASATFHSEYAKKGAFLTQIRFALLRTTKNLPLSAAEFAHSKQNTYFCNA